MIPISVRAIGKIDFSGPCWIWTGARNRGGYGVIHVGHRLMGLAHRVVYEVFVGPIPAGRDLDHTCRRGRDGCVTPWHLEPVTGAENRRRSRRDRCRKGHDMADAYVVPGGPRAGNRQCRVCRHERRIAA